jgi:hypothetical protein
MIRKDALVSGFKNNSTTGDRISDAQAALIAGTASSPHQSVTSIQKAPKHVGWIHTSMLRFGLYRSI